jgi:hypothetical protein
MTSLKFSVFLSILELLYCVGSLAGHRISKIEADIGRQLVNLRYYPPSVRLWPTGRVPYTVSIVHLSSGGLLPHWQHPRYVTRRAVNTVQSIAHPENAVTV